ncbi:MAG: hypothetical protein KJ630_24685 [Proteobacteria bacterium]|nr:hypothetical protein [Pseudomonadota bacterium]
MERATQERSNVPVLSEDGKHVVYRGKKFKYTIGKPQLSKRQASALTQDSLRRRLMLEEAAG